MTASDRIGVALIVAACLMLMVMHIVTVSENIHLRAQLEAQPSAPTLRYAPEPDGGRCLYTVETLQVLGCKEPKETP